MILNAFINVFCKVEINQPSCWLYSVPNLLVILQLVTLYLGENHVRLVCERVWRNAQVCAKQQGLAGGKPLDDAYEWSMQRRWIVTSARALQDKKSSLAILFARGLNSRLSQVARPSHQPTFFRKTWLFAFYSHSSINTPYTHEIQSWVPASLHTLEQFFTLSHTYYPYMIPT